MSKLGKREVWPKIKPAINHGKPVYVVDARIAGKGERRFFETKDEAEGWASVQRVRRKNQGDRAFDDSELSVYGLSVADAVKFHAHLAKRWEALALLVFSGNESLHGWYPCAGVDEERVIAFLRYACRLGADHALSSAQPPDILNAIQQIRLTRGQLI
jgi:hypothetical protein